MRHIGREPTYREDTHPEIAYRVLANKESKAAVCAEIGISRPTLYEWCKNYPTFNLAVAQGMEAGQRKMESIGQDGIEGKIDNFSAPTYKFVMTNRYREDYWPHKEEQRSVSDTLVEKLIDKL